MLEKPSKFHLASFGEKEIYFLSNIYSEGTLAVQGIRSKLILNEIKYSAPLLLLYPTKEKLADIDNLFEVEVKGILELMGGQEAGEIHIPKAYVENSNRTQFETSWEECIVEISPCEIYQVHYLKDQIEGTSKKHSIVFCLTENRMLRPWGIIERSFTGEVKSEFHPRVTLNFADGWIGAFENHHQYAKANIEEAIGDFSSSKLVLHLKKEDSSLLSIQDVTTISELVDRLLLYLSFASRQKTTWVSWSSQMATEFVEYYRNIVIPQKISVLEEPLISKRLFQKFSQHCLEYLSCNENLNLYFPLLYLVSADNPRKTIESEFLSLFISLEALLHLYARKLKKTKHFTDDDWKKIGAHIRRVIKELQCLDSKQKKMMADKIGIFNQTSNRFLYDDFCEVMQVDNSDLWPLFGNGLTLSKIRNKLIHGIQFDYEPYLTFAKVHLKWIIERCLLAAIGWVGWGNDSNVDSDTLTKYNPYREWKQYYCGKEK